MQETSLRLDMTS